MYVCISCLHQKLCILMRSVVTSGLLTARAAAEKRDSGDPVLVLALGLR